MANRRIAAIRSPKPLYNRTIFSDVNPFSAFRVSTISRAFSTSAA